MFPGEGMAMGEFVFLWLFNFLAIDTQYVVLYDQTLDCEPRLIGLRNCQRQGSGTVLQRSNMLPRWQLFNGRSKDPFNQQRAQHTLAHAIKQSQMCTSNGRTEPHVSSPLEPPRPSVARARAARGGGRISHYRCWSTLDHTYIHVTQERIHCGIQWQDSIPICSERCELKVATRHFLVWNELQLNSPASACILRLSESNAVLVNPLWGAVGTGNKMSNWRLKGTYM